MATLTASPSHSASASWSPSVSPGPTPLPFTERYALELLYNETGGASWANASRLGWSTGVGNESSDPCKWAGMGWGMML